MLESKFFPDYFDIPTSMLESKFFPDYFDIPTSMWVTLRVRLRRLDQVRDQN